MPRRTFFKKRGKRFKLHRQTNKSVSKRLTKLTKFVYKTIETKYNDIRYAPAGIQATGWTSWSLADIDAGTGSTNDERVGDQVTISSLKTQISIDKCQGDDYVRVMIVQFDDVDDAESSTYPDNILEYNVASNNASGNNMDPIMSPYKAGSALKFKILYDKVLHPLNRKQISVSEQVSAINCKRMITINNSDLRKYNDVLHFQPGANQTRPIRNGIYLYIYSTSERLTSVDGQSNAFVVHRMKYRDA